VENYYHFFERTSGKGEDWMIRRIMKCRLFTQKATVLAGKIDPGYHLLIRNKLGRWPIIDYQLKSTPFGRTCQRLITGRKKLG
jgi:hypothetical protein